MAEQRVPNLQEMDEQQANRFLTDLVFRLSAQAEGRIRHEDYTMEWPQSGERLRGRLTMREFQEANSGSRPPRRLRRVLVREGLWVVEGVVDYGWGGKSTSCSSSNWVTGSLQRDPLLRRSVRGI
jgi:hypothetical protein